MKKILALILILIMVLSLAACTGKKPADSAVSDTSADKTEVEAEPEVIEGDGTVTEEQYVAGVKFVKENADKTYAEVAAVFGEGGAKTLDDMWSDEYHYYAWTDGTREFIVTFTVKKDVEIAAYFTGDINV